jgi:hypothetical protein
LNEVSEIIEKTSVKNVTAFRLDKPLYNRYFWNPIAIVTPTKNMCLSFFTLSNISKDAEFEGLSETRLNFLGLWDTKRLEAKY